VKNKERKREQFLRDPLPIRLAGIAADLVDLQRMIVAWRRAWPEARQSQTQRTLFSVQAKKWSDHVLGFSG
jgi:hypothetical protein